MAHRIEPTARPRYRADIDGLRAVAVLLVIATHLHTIKSGFIGVDIFFVISGYLISSIIMTGLHHRTFSVADFYEHRIRRIVPALVVVMLATCAAAYRWDTPFELQALGSSLIAALFSVSNVLFFHQAGYFEAESALKPLLHTWSLAVEEQFYLLFPLILTAVCRYFPRHIRGVIWCLTASSFALSCFWVDHNPSAAYFLAPSRAWELLVGTIASQHYLPRMMGQRRRNLFALLGVVLLLGAAIAYQPETRFPGLAALAPCLGAALIIASGETGPTFVSAILSTRILVFIGLISYSLYLWHWPLIVFQDSSNLLHLKPGGHGVALILLCTSLILAALSWRFVERPFRTGSHRPNRSALLCISGSAALLVISIALTLVFSQGLPERFPPAAQDVAKFLKYDHATSYRENVCFLIEPKSSFADFKPDICLQRSMSASLGGKKYLLLGDSHAAALFPGLSAVYSDASIYQATAAGCRPFIPAKRDLTADATCQKLLDYVYGDFLVHHHVDAVLLSGRWQHADTEKLSDTVYWMQNHGIATVLFGPMIEFDTPLPRLIALAIRDQKVEQIGIHRALGAQTLDEVLAAMHLPATYISSYEDLCDRSERQGPQTLYHCPIWAAAGVPLLFDTDHLTKEGSILFAKAIQSRGQLP